MIKISEMTGKLTDIPAINTNTLTNSFCTKMHAKTSQEYLWCVLLAAYDQNVSS